MDSYNLDLIKKVMLSVERISDNFTEMNVFNKKSRRKKIVYELDKIKWCLDALYRIDKMNNNITNELEEFLNNVSKNLGNEKDK